MNHIKFIIRPIWRLYIKIWRSIFQWFINKKVFLRFYFFDRHKSKTIPDIEVICNRVKEFCISRQGKNNKTYFTYSHASKVETLYSSVYACLLTEITNGLTEDLDIENDMWLQYFDSFQSPDTGLFFDRAIDCEWFLDSDWWGARHLALHLIGAYRILGAIPRHEFKFLKNFNSIERISLLLPKSLNEVYSNDSDFDNKLMNIICLMQFERDFRGLNIYNETINYVISVLEKNLNKDTGLWGSTPRNSEELSRSVQISYHLFPILIYDGIDFLNYERIAKSILATQNRAGGFGVALNSSACEDIDSSDLLIWVYPYLKYDTQSIVNDALRKHGEWIAANQCKDGGFVFRKHQKFIYGHRNMRGDATSGAMFPTWFRMLSLYHLNKHLNGKQIAHHRSPGYYFMGQI
jgi:hypothetical protein